MRNRSQLSLESWIATTIQPSGVSPAVVDLTLGQPVGQVNHRYGRVVLLLGSALELVRDPNAIRNLLSTVSRLRGGRQQQVRGANGDQYRSGASRTRSTTRAS